MSRAAEFRRELIKSPRELRRAGSVDLYDVFPGDNGLNYSTRTRGFVITREWSVGRLYVHIPDIFRQKRVS